MPLRFLIALLALAPALSLVNLWAVRVVAGATGAAQAHFVLAFILAPLATALALAARSKAALVLYPLVGLALATFPTAATGVTPSLPLAAASVAAVFMAATGTLLVCHELLFRNVRYRRRSMRFFLQRKIALIDGRERHPAVLRDCSELGLGVTLSARHAGGFLRALTKGHAVDIEIGGGLVRGLLVWRREVGEVVDVGLEVEPGQVLSDLLAQCRADPLVAKASRIEGFLKRRYALGALAAAWVLATLLAYGLPAVA